MLNRWSLLLCFGLGLAAAQPGPDDCVDQAIHPNPDDCHSYYQCTPDGSGGWDIDIFMCGDGLVFHPDLLVCVFPENAPDGLCDGQTTTEPVSTTQGSTTSAGPTTTRPPQDGKMIVCYFGAWAIYRPGHGKFHIDDIDPTLCTHAHYGFAAMSNQTWEAYSYDPWFDLCPEENGNYCGYQNFNNLKKINPDLKTVLAIGGWNEGSGKYSMMAKDPEKRAKFVNSAVAMVEKYGFDGLDMDWEYPGNREGADPDVDKQDFVELLRELRAALQPKGKILTAALSPGKPTIDIAYDVPAISELLDIMSVMCYDYHGWWEEHGFTGENAPLYGKPEEDFEGHPGYYFNVDDTINYWLELGAPKEKIVMGMPIYGRGFTLARAEDADLYCEATDGIPKGPYTRQKGYWSYLEIAEKFTAEPGQWTKTVDSCYLAPYAVNGRHWIGYDDEESIKIKSQYINTKGLAGGMIWSLDIDDFKGLYSDRKYPILSTIYDTLASGETLSPENIDPESCSAPMCEL